MHDRCIEEDDFDCKLHASSCSSWSPYPFLKHRQSVFLLFIGFVCSVVVMFCRYLCSCLWSLCWLCCLRCAKRCSLSFAISCCRRLLRSRCLILVGVLQRSFGGKSSPARISSHLLCLLFCVICMGNCSWSHDSPIVNIVSQTMNKHISPSRTQHESAPWSSAVKSMLPGNAKWGLWRTPSDIFKERFCWGLDFARFC